MDNPGIERASALRAGLLPRSPKEVGAAQRLLPAGRSDALERLAELACRLLEAPSAQVSLLTEVQTVAGGSGVTSGAVGVTSRLCDSLCALTADADAPLLVVDASADRRVSGLPPVASGDVGSYLGVPLHSDSGVTVGALCVYGPFPHEWRAGDTAVLEQLAASVVAELELAALAEEYEASRAHWELAIDAAGIGGFDLDLRSGQLTWDDRLLELFGYDRETFVPSVDAFTARVHPDDVARITQARQEAVDTVGTYEAEYRIRLPSGRNRWVQARGRALGDESGRAVRLLGAAHDVTDLREGEARFAAVLESMSAAFLALDRDWRFTYVNAEAERLLGFSRHDLVGGVIWELFPAAVSSAFEDNYRRSAERGEPTVFEAFYPAPLDAWYEVRVWPGPDGISVYFLDVTARRQAQDDAERAAARAALLADVTSELTGTLDADEAARILARLVVPALAEWCVVSLVDDEKDGPIERRMHDVGWWHADPASRPAVASYAELRLGSMSGPTYLSRALATGRPVELPRGATPAIAAVLDPGAARDLLVDLGPESAVVVPLRAHERTLGMMTLFRGPGTPAMSEDETKTLLEVAARAGLALDNARLYARQRDLAEGLQRSLLTEPPQPVHGQIVVRYTPAAETAQVGGDWYDAFSQGGGATVLVIGDVVGHDTAAAAAMGQVRGLLRGIAATTGDGPAGVLGRLDAAMDLLALGTTATAVVLRLEESDAERRAGVTRVCWSNAGHPPPMAVSAAGDVTVLEAGGGPDLLLGVDLGSARTESETTLGRGATVLLYTDGLVERRHQSLDDGIARLRDLLGELADRSLDELCDTILARMLPDAPEDDVALVAVRLSSGPASAG